MGHEAKEFIQNAAHKDIKMMKDELIEIDWQVPL